MTACVAHVGVRVAREAQLVRDLDPAEHEATAGLEAVRVPADPDPAGAHGAPIGAIRRSRRSNTDSSRTPWSSSSSSACS